MSFYNHSGGSENGPANVDSTEKGFSSTQFPHKDQTLKSLVPQHPQISLPITVRTIPCASCITKTNAKM